MSSATEAILTAAITVTLAGAVGYGLFRLISPRNETANPLALGRRWFAWMAMIVSFATLPPFFRLFDANSIAKWLVGLVIFGGLAFGFGWLYGRFFKFNAPGNVNSSRPSEARIQTTNGTKARETAPSNSYPDRSQQSFSASWAQGSTVGNQKQTVNVEEEFWAQALAEIENENTKPALWAKAFSLSDGEDQKARAKYLQLRVDQLLAERTLELAEQHRRAEEKLVAERSAEIAEQLRREEVEMLERNRPVQGFRDWLNVLIGLVPFILVFVVIVTIIKMVQLSVKG